MAIVNPLLKNLRSKIVSPNKNLSLFLDGALMSYSMGLLENNASFSCIERGDNVSFQLINSMLDSILVLGNIYIYIKNLLPD